MTLEVAAPQSRLSDAADREPEGTEIAEAVPLPGMPAPRQQTVRINREVPIPYYYQLEGLLRQQISTGRWRGDEQTPSEKQLCELYSVSRTTVRLAIGHLVTEGLLYHIKGKGTFVRRP